MKSNEFITVDAEVLSGKPVFKGTRVPIETLFDYLEYGQSMSQFLEEFPTVKKNQVIQVLEMANKIISSKNIEQIYETVVG